MIGPWWLQLGCLAFDLALLVLIIWAVVRWDERRIARQVEAESARAAASRRPFRMPVACREPLDPRSYELAPVPYEPRFF